MSKEKVYYYEKQFLKADEFNDEQSYHIENISTHNLNTHGKGIVKAPKTFTSEFIGEENEKEIKINVSKCYAIDGSGNELNISNVETLNINSKNIEESNIDNINYIEVYLCNVERKLLNNEEIEIWEFDKTKYNKTRYEQVTILCAKCFLDNNKYVVVTRNKKIDENGLIKGVKIGNFTKNNGIYEGNFDEVVYSGSELKTNQTLDSITLGRDESEQTIINSNRIEIKNVSSKLSVSFKESKWYIDSNEEIVFNKVIVDEIQANKFVYENLSLVPKGSILFWYGLKNGIPKGYNSCNGENGVPNLVNNGLNSSFHFMVVYLSENSMINIFLGSYNGEKCHLLEKDDNWIEWRDNNKDFTVRYEITQLTRTINRKEIINMFIIDSSGNVHFGTYEAEKLNWEWYIIPKEKRIRSSITAVSRYLNGKQIDIYAKGDDGKVYTAYYTEDNKVWNGWYIVGNIDKKVNGDITVISKNSNKDVVDLFVVGDDGKVYTNSYNGNEDPKDWYQVGDFRNPDIEGGFPDNAITNVVVIGEDMRLFVGGSNGIIYTTSYLTYKRMRSWNLWSEFIKIPNGIQASYKIQIVRRYKDLNSSIYDFFVVGGNNVIYNIVYDKKDGLIENREISVPIDNFADMSVISKKEKQMDLFITSYYGEIYTSSYNDDNKKWSDWKEIYIKGIYPIIKM